MIGAVRTSATGLQSQESLIDATANNLANVDTTAFKRNRVGFQDLFYLALRTPSGAQGSPPAGSQVGLGAAVASTDKVLTAGPLENTGGELDLAIEGDGF